MRADILADEDVEAALARRDIFPDVKPRHGFGAFVACYPSITLGGTLLLALIMIAILAPYLGTSDPTALSPASRLRPPSQQHWFGTDLLGRDIYSRVIYGARVSLTGGGR